MGRIRKRKKKNKDSTNSTEDQILEFSDLLSKPEKKKKNLFHTGSTMLNLVLSDSASGGWKKGKIENLIGDSSSGKTFIAKSTLAEMCYNPEYDNYRLIFDDVEEADEFDDNLFGKLKDRVEPPSFDDNGNPKNSDTIQDFHDNILDALDRKRPFIYVLDSLDALDAEEDQKKVEEQRIARKKGNNTKGTFGTAKPKIVSWILKNIKGKLKKHGSTVIIISQVRDKIDTFGFGPKKTRSGGRALKFYSCHEIWMVITKNLKKRDRSYGVISTIKCSKNKITGKARECKLAIYYDYGIDDIGSMIDFLVNEKYWKKKKNTIIVHNWEDIADSTREKLILQLQDNEEKLKELSIICENVWHQIEESIKTKRSKKYK